MYNTRSSLYDRIIEKTPKPLFVNSLRKEFELSPAESHGILDLAKQCLFGRSPQAVGKIKYICASQHAKHGMNDVKELSRLLGQSERLTVKYLQVFERHIKRQ